MLQAESLHWSSSQVSKKKIRTHFQRTSRLPRIRTKQETRQTQSEGLDPSLVEHYFKPVRNA